MNTLDRAVNTDFLVVSKSLLPYLNSDKQRTVAIFIKVMELVYTMNLFSNEASVRSMSRSQESGWEKAFLNDVKNNLSSDKAYFIDAILKLTEAKDLLSRQSDDSSDDSDEPKFHMHPDDSGILNSLPFPDEKPAHSNEHTHTTQSAQSSPLPSPDQLISGLSSFLEPNQAQLLKVISSLLTPNH